MEPTPTAPDASDAPSFDAFVSYSHHDSAVARGVQRGLGAIGRRFGQLHALRVFRDSTDLTASPDLWGKVTAAMDTSRYLVVVLSPKAASSRWVDKELSYWLDRKGPRAPVPGHRRRNRGMGRLEWMFRSSTIDRSARAADQARGPSCATLLRGRQRGWPVGSSGAGVPGARHRSGRAHPGKGEIRARR